MPRCIYCGRLQLLKPLTQGGFCKACDTYESKVELCKSIIQSTLLSNRGPSKYQSFINSLLNNKQKGACIVDIIGDYDTPGAWYCMAIAYQLQGAKFRLEQIKYSRKLLDSGQPLEESAVVYIHNLLADAYEGEYMFEEAIEVYNQLLSKHKDYNPARIKIARLLVKQNRIDEAIKYLEKIYKKLKNNPVYYTDPFSGKKKLDAIYKSDLLVLSSHIKEFKEKKERGYVYRPRKRKVDKESVAGR